MKNKPYNGHKNKNHWNVALWIKGDEGLYRTALDYISEFSNKDNAAEAMLNGLNEMGIYKTPDGAPYSKSSIRAAMIGM